MKSDDDHNTSNDVKRERERVVKKSTLLNDDAQPFGMEIVVCDYRRRLH